MREIRQLYTRYIHNVIIAIEAIMANTVKSLLTALGIMFGVAAVISMLAIGKGAQQEVLEQIKLVGVNNIIITPVKESVVSNANQQSDEEGEEKKGKRKSNGLTLSDAHAILKTIPSVAKVSPVVSMNYYAINKGKSQPIVLEGVSTDYFSLLNIGIVQGKAFSKEQNQKSQPVCVIGYNVKDKFFNQDNPIGKYIKVGENWLQVVGVAEKRDFTTSASDEMGISSSDNKVFVPTQSLLLRYKDRSRINPVELERMSRGGGRGRSTQVSNAQIENQLDKIVVQVKETEQLSATADIIKRMLLRRHSNMYDFQVTVPELLLKQQQKTNDIFNIVLGAIAGISLLVGGIGIMNIMLASVWERIREIGTRQAIGASRKDIIVQFLSESTLISIGGGIIGVIIGVLMAYTIEVTADIKTIVSFWSVFIAFGVSATVGVVFGYIPARSAANQDPVESLRH
ncbi:putative ABC transport system permease protein [Saccharicrinis carchari]|uniref:Putative ABC transport system permease protein n=1 Tax=Saccharicrinis carchari TaxID=1168039 RepID=A0A521EDG5_SACCC|nr:ABC transporter permease [Saccharicrinis carchari]SMO81230.1 putative ABC transport system permease protein [Saccharicrinis carchari]